MNDMKNLFDEISYDCSKRVTEKYSTSFSLAVRMLSPQIRDSILAIYGFVRFADEIVDTFHDYDQKELFEEFVDDLNKALERKISMNPILNSFQEVVHKNNIDYDLIESFIASMRADLYKQEYKSVEEYDQYIYGSADVVGLMCLKVFVKGDAEQYAKLKHSAMKLGSAFQKVNFLRDFKDDMEILERSYFPNIDHNTLDSNSKDEIIADIEADFKEAFIGVKELPIDAKFGVYTAYIYYRKLLSKLNKIEAEKIRMSRVRVSNPIKMMLLTKSYLKYKLNLM